MDRRTVIGIVVSVVCLAGMAAVVNLGEVVSALRGANYALVALAAGLNVLGFWLRAQRFRWLTGGPGQRTLSAQEAFSATSIGAFTSNVLPARLGELARIVVASAHYGLSYPRAIAGTVLDRFCDAFWLLGAIGLALALQPRGVPVWIADTAAGCGCLVVLVLVLATGVGHGHMLRIVAVGSQILPSRMGAKVRGFAEEFLTSLSAPGMRRRFVSSVLLSALIWGIEIVLFYALVRAVDISPSWQELCVAFVIVSLGSTIPSAPGGIGPIQVASILAFEVIGGARASALALGALYQLIVLFPITPIGAFYLLREGLSVGSLKAKISGMDKDVATAGNFAVSRENL